MRILLIEDDADTVAYLQEGLRREHDMTIAMDGRAGLLQAAGEVWDLLIVDRLLPGLDGLSLVRILRAVKITTPTLFLTTLGGIDDRVTGLESGADDYLVKPFSLAELLARIEALGRRARRAAPKTAITVADLEVDLLTRSVRRAGETVDLQPREYQLLEYLLRNAGQVVTRSMLLEAVWDFHFDPGTKLVECNISRLRTKIDRDGRSPELIKTIRGAGYRIERPD